MLPDVFCLERPITHAIRTKRSSSTNARALPAGARRSTIMRRAEDAPECPRTALPRWPLGQPDDSTTRARERQTRSVRCGPRRALRVVLASWTRFPSSSVATKMRLPTLGGWADQLFDACVLVGRLLALDRSVRPFAEPRSLSTGRRGTDHRVRARESTLRAERQSRCDAMR